MNRRAEILNELIRFQSPTKPLLRELKSFGWDWPEEHPLVVLKKEDLLHVIDRFLRGELESAQLQEWAENLECREDIKLQEEDRERIDDVFFRIATPCINDPLTFEVVQKMRNELTKNKG